METILKPYKIYAEVVEQAALTQFYSAMAQPFVVRGALMADAHTGYSLPIGAVVATDGVVVPSWVGYDIGCGMCALRTAWSREYIVSHSKDIFDTIIQTVPVGFNHNQKDSVWPDHANLPKTKTLEAIFAENGLRQLGSLGGGNHFIEVGCDERGVVWIIIHSGSRGIGHAVARHYMKLASGSMQAKEGHYGLSVESEDGQNYITDMNFCLEFALANRLEIVKRIVDAVGLIPDPLFPATVINRNHNHAEEKDGMWIHRKGATHAEAGMMGVIPGNMRDGSFIVSGMGNQDSLWSSSHGAGRVLGRKAAKEMLSLAEFRESMQGVEQACVNADTLDESPAAYKDIFEVMRLQEDLVEIVAHVKPIINIKG